ncbi:MAG TPA: hypothetical protein VMU95_03410 [Trebonia sp.]|nr:hypothetical protein [Trebonia sp.]
MGDPLNPAARLAGFLVLLALLFAGAHLAGARLGPLTTSHSRVQYTGGGSGGSGGMDMNMGTP